MKPRFIILAIGLVLAVLAIILDATAQVPIPNLSSAGASPGQMMEATRNGWVTKWPAQGANGAVQFAEGGTNRGINGFTINASTADVTMTGNLLISGGVTSSGVFNGDGSLLNTLNLRVSTNGAVVGTEVTNWMFWAGTNVVLQATNRNGLVDVRINAANTPGGADTQVQFNDSGAFGGDSGLVYNKTTDSLTVSGSLTVNANISSGANILWDGVATGDGSGISALNASSLASGTANPARLATNSAFSNSWLRATSASTSEWSRDGSGLTNLPPPAPLQPQTRIYLKDEFASGNITSGSIGELGWVFDAIGSGGGVSQVSTTYGHPQMGVVRVYSTVNAAGETLSSGNSGYINSATNRSWRVTFVGNTDQTTAVRLYFGLGDGTTALQANGIGFRYDTTLGDTAWMAYVMSGGTQSATTTGVAVNTTAFPRFQIECNSAGTITYFIDGTQVATRTTGGPATTVFLRLQAQILSDGAVTRHWNFDYFAFTEASTR